MKSEFPGFSISTKQQFVLLWILVSSFCVLCGKTVAQTFRAVHPGVEYVRVDHRVGNDPVKINLLRLDLTKVRLDVRHAFDKAIGVEPTSAIASRHRAVAAINAGFFRLDKSPFAGDAAGILKIDGKIWSEDLFNRTALFVFNAAEVTEVAIGTIDTELRVDGKNDTVAVDGVNRERKDNEVVVFTPEFHRSTLTTDGGMEAVIVRGKVVQIIDGKGNNPVPGDGFVISASGTAIAGIRGKLKQLRNARFGAAEMIERSTISDDHRAIGRGYLDKDIVGGVPRLIKEGKIDITWQQEKAGRSFVEMRHPRTAVAKLKDGKFLMITVDGRQPGVSVGMTLQELAEYLLSLGATDAMNLDGGGSTTMFLDGKVVNTPSDKEGERKVSDAILVTLRKNARR